MSPPVMGGGRGDGSYRSQAFLAISASRWRPNISSGSCEQVLMVYAVGCAIDRIRASIVRRRRCQRTKVVAAAVHLDSWTAIVEDVNRGMLIFAATSFYIFARLSALAKDNPFYVFIRTQRGDYELVETRGMAVTPSVASSLVTSVRSPPRHGEWARRQQRSFRFHRSLKFQRGPWRIS